MFHILLATSIITACIWNIFNCGGYRPILYSDKFLRSKMFVILADVTQTVKMIPSKCLGNPQKYFAKRLL